MSIWGEKFYVRRCEDKCEDKAFSIMGNLDVYLLYNEVFGLIRQDKVEGVLSGEKALNQVFLVRAAILMAIPIFMIFLSLALPAKVNHWVNIIAGIVYPRYFGPCTACIRRDLGLLPIL
jgi:hypothetical protein